MTKIIGIHSFRRGTGKTFFVVNLGLLLAQEGWRVGLVDTDFQSPGIHIQFQMTAEVLPHTLNDYLHDRCSIGETVYEVTSLLNKPIKGKNFIIPASSNLDDITTILRQGYSIEKLSTGLNQVCKTFALDALLIDTSAGLTEENLRSLALADSVAIVLLPDQQHYQGTAVITDLARKLDVPSISLIINQVPDIYDPEQVKQEIETAYQASVAAFLPVIEEYEKMERFFVLDYPEHPLTVNLMQMVLGLLK